MRRKQINKTYDLDLDATMDSLDFGLFDSRPRWFDLVHQSVPVVWTGLVYLWPVLLSGFLRMLWCVPIPEDGEESVIFTYRLLPSPEIQCWADPHFPSALTAVVGLLVWCAGIPGLLALRLLFLADRQSPGNFRKYGFFIQGYEAKYWWWDIIVKRLDVGVMMLITYTSVVPTPEGKLLCYPVLSGLQLCLAAWIAPFTNEQAGVLDVLEVALQISRFLLFSTVVALMVLSPSHLATAGLAVAVLVLLMAAGAYLVVHVASQIFRDARALRGSGVRRGNALMKFIGALPPPPRHFFSGVYIQRVWAFEGVFFGCPGP